MRSLVKYMAVIIRARLCIQPILFAWRIPASTIGTPVLPSFHACKWAALFSDSQTTLAIFSWNGRPIDTRGNSARTWL